MEVVTQNNYISDESGLVEQIVYELKSQGIFDNFRKECISDVDTKPAYQNLRQRVEGSVSGFLKEQEWSPDLNKNYLREQLRKTIYESGFLETGLERIVDQVVNPKINSVFLPKVEDVVYKFLGLEKPNRPEVKKELKLDISHLLPNDLEAVSPESNHDLSDEKKDESMESQNLDDSKKEDESPAFETLNRSSIMNNEENSVDSNLSGMSGLQSHESNHSGEMKISQETSNQDSQASQNSLSSQPSIETSEENTKMEICQDSLPDSNSKTEEIVEKMDVSEQVDEIQIKDNNNEVTEKSEVSQDKVDNVDKTSEEVKTKENSEVKPKENSEVKPKENSEVKSEEKKSKHSDKPKSSRSDKDRKDVKDKKHRSSSKDSKDHKSSSSHRRESSSHKKDSKSSSRDKDRKDKESSSKDKDKRNKETNGKDRDASEKSKSNDKSKERSKEKSRDRPKSKERESEKSKERESEKSKERESEKSKERESEKSKERESDKSKDRDKSSDKSSSKSREKDKDKSEKSREKDKDRKSSSSSSKHSSSKSSSSSKKESSSSDKDKERSSSSSKDKKVNGEHKSHSSSSSDKDKHRKSDSHSSKHSSKKSKDKKSGDDHYSFKDKKNDRRSTDRDSNDGSSKISRNSSFGESNTSSQKSKSTSDATIGNGSGDSGNSEAVESEVKEDVTPVMVPMPVETKVAGDVKMPVEIQQVKYIKPKFASNIFEARKLMKIRKQLAKLEKQQQQNQLALAENRSTMQLDVLVPTEIIVSSEVIVPAEVIVNGISEEHEEIVETIEDAVVEIDEHENTVVETNEHKNTVVETDEHKNTVVETDERENTVVKTDERENTVVNTDEHENTEVETDEHENTEVKTDEHENAAVDVHDSSAEEGFKGFNPSESDTAKKEETTIEEILMTATNLSQANWEALEARLAQEMSRVDHNSYGFPEDEDVNCYTSSPLKKHSCKDTANDTEVKDAQIVEVSVVESATNEENTSISSDKENQKVETENEVPAVETMDHSVKDVDDVSDSNKENKIVQNEDISSHNGDKRSPAVTSGNNVKKSLYVDLPKLNVTSESSEHNLRHTVSSIGVEEKICDNSCTYLEKLSARDEDKLNFIHDFIRRLEVSIEGQKALMRRDVQKIVKNGKRVGRKRKIEDVTNNNKAVFENSKDATVNSFPLPLSPAESDKSNEHKKDDFSPIPSKVQRRSINKKNQRYSSEDLYKPRPVFTARRRGAKS